MLRERYPSALSDSQRIAKIRDKMGSNIEERNLRTNVQTNDAPGCTVDDLCVLAEHFIVHAEVATDRMTRGSGVGSATGLRSRLRESTPGVLLQKFIGDLYFFGVFEVIVAFVVLIVFVQGADVTGLHTSGYV
ncbi:hypothetical protein PC128_g13127 [Phytophthora cactorum]|nr:hypothetical protein PC120_g15103 [Phytophthora cactorum]KAG3186037.1 hypothetical protein PC128_g13127 [Phytophthora cactorum]KAG4055149.1 hypothetical protein PC123_g9751 [Phytophthora cactorum]